MHNVVLIGCFLFYCVLFSKNGTWEKHFEHNDDTLLNVILLAFCDQVNSTECHSSECHSSECHSSECLSSECHSSECQSI